MASKTRRPSVPKDPGIDRNADVDLLPTTELLHTHLTSALCQTVFKELRTTERSRQWSLNCLAEFWTAVILRAPDSLTQALQEAAQGTGTWPHVQATPEAFFSRCQSLKWQFFAKIFSKFRDSLLPSAPATFFPELHFLRKRFADVLVVDGSRLEKIAHRLKILHDIPEAVLPGCLLAIYDLFRGLPRWVRFDPDAAKGELPLLKSLLPEIPSGSLLIGDRLYASVDLVMRIRQRGIHGLFRLNGHLKIQKVRCLSSTKTKGVTLEDWLVNAGGGSTAPIQELRLLRRTEKDEVHELLTTVMDPKLLSAEEAMALYPHRWSVERMFFDLKEVLNLHRLYAANPNAIAMQLYAAAMVYLAMRVAQVQVALKHDLDPSLISPKKFFVRMAAASATLTGYRLGAAAVREANPGVHLVEPNPAGERFVTAKLGSLLVEQRRGLRKKKPRAKDPNRWLTLRHVPDHEFLEN